MKTQNQTKQTKVTVLHPTRRGTRVSLEEAIYRMSVCAASPGKAAALMVAWERNIAAAVRAAKRATR
jgi:hypothetical protein